MPGQRGAASARHRRGERAGAGRGARVGERQSDVAEPHHADYARAVRDPVKQLSQLGALARLVGGARLRRAGGALRRHPQTCTSRKSAASCGAAACARATSASAAPLSVRVQRAPSDPPFPGPGSRNVLCATHRLPGRCSACLGPWSRTAAQDCSRRLARSRAPSWIPHAGGHRCRGDWRRRFVILGTLPRNRSPAGYDPHSPVTSRQDFIRGDTQLHDGAAASGKPVLLLPFHHRSRHGQHFPVGRVSRDPGSRDPSAPAHAGRCLSCAQAPAAAVPCAPCQQNHPLTYAVNVLRSASWP